MQGEIPVGYVPGPVDSSILEPGDEVEAREDIPVRPGTARRQTVERKHGASSGAIASMHQPWGVRVGLDDPEEFRVLKRGERAIVANDSKGHYDIEHLPGIGNAGKGGFSALPRQLRFLHRRARRVLDSGSWFLGGAVDAEQGMGYRKV